MLCERATVYSLGSLARTRELVFITRSAGYYTVFELFFPNLRLAEFSIDEGAALMPFFGELTF